MVPLPRHGSHLARGAAVSEIPFGFGKPGDPNDPGSRGPGGGGMGFGDLGGADISSALHRFADMLSWQGGPVNWDLAKDVARQAAAGDDPSIGPAERRCSHRRDPAR